MAEVSDRRLAEEALGALGEEVVISQLLQYRSNML
jgi:hypothetical protein